jgi:hypothetical protein
MGGMMHDRPMGVRLVVVLIVALFTVLGSAGAHRGSAYAQGEPALARTSSFADVLQLSGVSLLIGDSVEFGDTCDRLIVFGKTAFVDGEVKGDAYVVAETIEIGSHTRIGGTLYACAASDPVMYRGAEVSDVVFAPLGTNANLS